MPDISRRAKQAVQQRLQNRNRQPAPSQSNLNRTVFNDSMALLIQFDDSYETLNFQFVPSALKVNRSINQQPIQIVARNNPRYQYLGGAMTYSFRLDFHAETDDRLDVIERVRKLESYTMTDGGRDSVPTIQVIWGDVIDERFSFIISALSYELSEFGGSTVYRDETGQLVSDSTNINNPRQAYVNITLSRISDTNLTRADVL